MENQVTVSDELIKLTNILGVRIENLQFMEGTDKWFFRMIITPQNMFSHLTSNIEVYQVSMFTKETWVSCMMTNENFQELLNR